MDAQPRIKHSNNIYLLIASKIQSDYHVLMQLTLYTDYSLRVLLYLAERPDRRVTISEMTDFYQVSRNHLVKVVHNLGQLGLIQTIRGKSGGMVLALDPQDINIGDVVRSIEPHMNLLECFDKQTNTCPIISQCGLLGIVYEARKAFMDVLNNYTLANLSPKHGMATHIPISAITSRTEVN